jgi:hypothetical protein
MPEGPTPGASFGDPREGSYKIHRCRPSRMPAPCGRLPAVSLLTDLDAFSTEHRRCGDLDAGVDGPIVWIAYDCGVRMARRVDEEDNRDATDARGRPA